jgi:Holliday junction resolvase RusA-like endonuclease
MLYDEVFQIESVAQERARARIIFPKDPRKKPFASYYDPPKSKDFKEELGKLVEISRPIEPFDVPMIMSCKIYITRPKSVTIAKREYPEVKPDLSNYIKGIEDAMNGLVYTDDSKIVGYRDCYKLYADEGVPRIEVKLWQMKI